MIRHVVSWGLEAQDAAGKAEQAAFVGERLMSLPPLIPEILHMTVGANAVDIDGNWDMVLVADYEDEAALRAYIEHPEHQKVVALIKPFLATRSAVDFVV
ncbi:MAG: stress responsive alpha-beta barrel protein [Microbacteriaceae bacterium]|nr:stress responsive alpha-beta barrel protein [Microbacteriaceae bacterium]